MMDQDIEWMVEIASITDGPEADAFLAAVDEARAAEQQVRDTAAAASAVGMDHPAFPRLLELNRAAAARLERADGAARAAGVAWLGE
jgi:hypothetical protein